MKNYNLKNYIRYKEDLKSNSKKNKPWKECTNHELIIMLMPYVETIARSFSTADKASGIVSINDMIQEGNTALVKAVEKIDWDIINEEDNIEKQIKGFLKKRIYGAIRRAVDTNRGDMRIPEHKLNEIRKSNGDDKRIIRMFFNSIFVSLDEKFEKNNFDVKDTHSTYNTNILNAYIKGLMRKYLDDKEYDVLCMSFGLSGDKMTAKKIAAKIGIYGSADYVRVSQIKKEAIDKLVENVEIEQVIDYL